MPQQRLQDSKRVTLSASGSGTVRFGPDRPNVQWTVTRVSCQVATNTNEAQFRLYRGNAGTSTYISGSVSGSTGDTDDGLSEVLQAGEFLTAEWTGGDVGAQATVTYWGDIVVP